MIDLMPLVEAMLSLASAAVVAAIPILVPRLLKRLRISDQSDLARRIEVAAMAGAGAAYNYALERAKTGGLANLQVRHDALANGVNHVLRSLPDTLRELHINDEHVRMMVEARLGELLARDPTVGAMTSAPTAA